jgi:hypothetical protein
MMITLNLISDRQRQRVRQRWAADEVRSMAVTAMFVVILASATLFGARHLLSTTRDMFETGLQATADQASISEADQAVARQLSATLNGSVDWADFLRRVAAAVPAGVSLSAVSVDENGNVQLAGRADTRANLLRLQNQLRDGGAVADLYSPVRNLLQPNDISFELTGRLASSTPQ